MNQTVMQILEFYIKGKDDDQYQMLEDIYAETAELKFKIDSEEIAFPTNINGNQEIARVLSKDFNQKYSMVKTYYLDKPTDNQLNVQQQNWLVVMQEKSNGLTRVGTGYYDWGFVKTDDGLQIETHKIYIHSMVQLQDTEAEELNRIQSVLNYPWTNPEKVIETITSNSQLKTIVNYLETNQ